MRKNKSLPLFIFFSFIIVELIPSTTVAMANQNAESIQIFNITQQDLDMDGTPDLTVIDCAFATEYDRVLVFDQDGDMQVGYQWEAITDFEDDVWVFDTEADGTAQLIIDFSIQGEQYIALLYDDMDDDGQVSYQIINDQIIIEESNFWHLKVESGRSWMQPGGLFDTKVTIFVDGYSGAGSRGGVVEGNDGEIDWHLEINDNNGDGIIDYSITRAISPYILSYRGYTTIRVQVTGRQPIPYSNPVFWPLLIDKSLIKGSYFDHTPAIAIDWATGIIEQEGILGYPIEAGYHIFSWLPLEKGIINSLNFENPMAYFDLAEDQDNWPELQIRFDVRIANDPYFPYPYEGQVDTPNLEVNISWDQDNDNRWDYKMNVGANYAINDVVEFPDFSIRSVPYDEIIPWVWQRTWDVAMLIYDDNPSPDSEGMFAKGWMIYRGYDNESIRSGLDTEYLMGFRNQPPVDSYQDIQEYMRGEYNFQYFDTPKVYLSSLDRQLHLFRAQSGVWNLGAGNYLRYANLDGDTYLDQWQEEHNGYLLQQLNYNRGIYLYSGNTQVLVKQVSASPAIFESQPPVNHTEWLALDARLQASQIDLLPSDFIGMLNLLSGTELQIQGAAIREYRVTPQGFRFVLRLEPGYTFQGERWLDLNGAAPGEYLVTYAGSFHLQTLTPPALVIRFEERQPNLEQLPIAYIQENIQAVIENQGLEDAQQVLVLLGTSQAEGKITWSAPQLVTVLAGESTPVSFPWAPPAAGEWKLQVWANLIDPGPPGGIATSIERVVNIHPAEVTSLVEEMSAFGVVAPWQVILLMASFLMVAALTGWVLTRMLREDARKQSPDPGQGEVGSK